MIGMKRVHILKVGEEPADFPKRSKSQIATSIKFHGLIAENLDKVIVGNIFSRCAASPVEPLGSVTSAASWRAAGNRDVAALRLHPFDKSGRRVRTTGPRNHATQDCPVNLRAIHQVREGRVSMTANSTFSSTRRSIRRPAAPLTWPTGDMGLPETVSRVRIGSHSMAIRQMPGNPLLPCGVKRATSSNIGES